jgi:hypothetical protein
LKGPCGSDGGRRRYDAASPEPMYRVKADGLAARQLHPAVLTIDDVTGMGKGRGVNPFSHIGLTHWSPALTP